MFALFICFASIGIQLTPGKVNAASEGSAGNQSSSEFGYESYRQSAARRSVCGLNALYVSLCLNGWELSFDKVEDALDGVPTEGTSLLQLRRACEKLGVKAEVMKSPVAELQTCRLPSLVYGSHGRLFSGPEAGQGHYVVLIDRTSDRAIYVESTTGEVVSAPMKWLLSGGGEYHYLDIEQRFQLAHGVPWLWLATGCLLAALAYRLTLSNRRGAMRIASRAMLILIAFATMNSTVGYAGIVETQKSYDQDHEGIWRRKDRDGVNSLYLFLRVNGRNVGYTELLSQLECCNCACSLLDLRDCAKSHGVDAIVDQLDPGSLSSVKKPVIALMHSERGEGNSFVVVCAVYEDKIDYVDGAFATWNEMPAEQFLREWSGFVVRLPDSQAFAFDSLMAIWSFASLTAFATIVFRFRAAGFFTSAHHGSAPIDRSG